MTHTRSAPSQQQSRDEKYRNWEAYESEQETEPNPFIDLIQKDPVVCDNCFLRRYSVISHEWWRGSFGWSDFVHWIPIDGRNAEVPASDSASQGTRLACSNCGYRRMKNRPVPKERIEEFAENISRTLDAKEIEHDRTVLFAEVEMRNTSENQGRQDSHVFKPAVQAAIRSTR